MLLIAIAEKMIGDVEKMLVFATGSFDRPPGLAMIRGFREVAH
jgi:hypothetical protein